MLEALSESRSVKPLIDIRNVTKVYEPLPAYMRFLLRTQVSEPVLALDGLSLALEPGEVCVVVGPNGAGKSTLFRILTGLITPTSGEALIDGLNVTRDSTRVRQKIGFAPAEERTLLMRHCRWPCESPRWWPRKVLAVVTCR